MTVFYSFLPTTVHTGAPAHDGLGRAALVRRFKILNRRTRKAPAPRLPLLMGQKSSQTLPLWSACAPESARARGLGISQGIDRPAWDGLGPKCKRWHPERVAAVPFLRNGEGKKSPLRRLPTDHRESLTQTLSPGQLLNSC